MNFNSFQGGGPFGPRKPDPVVDVGESADAAKILKKGLLRRLFLILILIVLVFLWNQCVVVTMPNEYNVIQQFGEIVSIAGEGVSFKIPVIQTVRSIPNAMMLYDIPISDVITQDKKTMVADSFVLWKVSDPTAFIRTLSGSVPQAETRVGNISYNSMKAVISGMEQTAIISGRDTLALKISENIGGSLSQYGVTLMGIETKSLDLPDDNKQAVYTRMISERNNIAASFQAEGEEEARMIRTETDKTVSILLSAAEARAAESIAEGERQYMEILADAYNDPAKAQFYAFTRALDAAKVSLGKGENTLILDPSSPIAQVFYNAGSVPEATAPAAPATAEE